MLSSLAIINVENVDSKSNIKDDNGILNQKHYITNKSILNNIINTDYYNARLMQTIVNIKKDFDKNISLSLFSRASLHRYPNRVHQDITDYIKQYFHNNTYPSPSPHQQVYVYDYAGNRIKHPKHYLYSTMKQFYDNFINDVLSKQLFTRLRCKPPSLSYFVQQKPSYVKKANRCEFDLCTHHANCSLILISLLKQQC